MKEPCTEYLKRAKVPHNNTPAAFNLENYMEKDISVAKDKAQAWGSGDFKALLKMNSKSYQPQGAMPVDDDIKPQEKPKEILPRRTGYHKRRMELSEIGIRIDALLRKNNTNIHKLSVAIKKKEHTIALAMQPNALTKRTTYEAIANYFGVSADYLINGEDKNG